MLRLWNAQEFIIKVLSFSNLHSIRIYFCEPVLAPPLRLSVTFPWNALFEATERSIVVKMKSKSWKASTSVLLQESELIAVLHNSLLATLNQTTFLETWWDPPLFVSSQELNDFWWYAFFLKINHCSADADLMWRFDASFDGVTLENYHTLWRNKNSVKVYNSIAPVKDNARSMIIAKVSHLFDNPLLCHEK